METWIRICRQPRYLKVKLAGGNIILIKHGNDNTEIGWVSLYKGVGVDDTRKMAQWLRIAATLAEQLDVTKSSDYSKLSIKRRSRDGLLSIQFIDDTFWIHEKLELSTEGFEPEAIGA